MSRRFFNIFLSRFTVALAVLFAIILAFGYQVYESRRDVAYSAAKEALTHVEIIISGFVEKTNMMEGFLHSIGEDKMREMEQKQENALYQKEFNLFASMLYDSKAIQALQLMPKGVNSYTYPIVGNQASVGLDVFSQEWARDGATFSMRSGMLNIEGPRELVQGNMALIVRNPVYYDDGTFWGFTTIILRLPDVVEPFSLSDLTRQGYQYQFEVLNDAEESVVLSSTLDSNDVDNTLTLSKNIAGRLTTIRLVPAQGWIVTKDAIYIILFFVVLAIVIGYMATRNKISSLEIVASLENEKHLRKVTAQAYKEAEQANTAKSDFLSAMSHDLRTPMNAIVGLCTLLAREADNPQKVLDYVRKLNASSQHLLGLINDILDMSKIESGKVSLNVRDFSLAALIENINTIVRPQARSRHQAFDIVAAGVEHEWLSADELRLNQILLNLLSNAVKYTQAGGHICLKVSETKSRNSAIGDYTFEISDNGMGMSEEFLAHVFEPFARSETVVNSAIQGTGLGMAITHNLIKLMGGTIDIDSKKGEGTKVTVHLSLKIKHEEIKDSEYLKSRSINNILIIDDEEISYDAASATLLEVGVNTRYARSFDDAIEQLDASAKDRSNIDLILLDLKLGEEDGVAIAHKLKDSAYKDVPIFILTAYDYGDVELKAMEAGVSGFLTKPLFVSNLKMALENSRQRLESNTNKVEDVSILKGCKILAAEDNELNSEILIDVLSMRGATCYVCKDGREIVETFKKTKPGEYDFILMDVRMPYLNGLEATREIRALDLPHAKTIPIIAMTANAFSDDIQASLDAGMNFHVSKPIDLGVLESCVRKVLPAKTFEPGGEKLTQEPVVPAGDDPSDLAPTSVEAQNKFSKVVPEDESSEGAKENDSASTGNNQSSTARLEPSDASLELQVEEVNAPAPDEIVKGLAGNYDVENDDNTGSAPIASAAVIAAAASSAQAVALGIVASEEGLAPSGGVAKVVATSHDEESEDNKDSSSVANELTAKNLAGMSSDGTVPANVSSTIEIFSSTFAQDPNESLATPDNARKI